MLLLSLMWSKLGAVGPTAVINWVMVVIGVEAAAVVTAVGPGLTGLQVGDRIAYAGRGPYSSSNTL